MNKIKLYKHQEEGIAFLSSLKDSRLKGKILTDSMGIGKTPQAIFSAKALAINSRKILIVCPATLKINWKREIKKFINEKALIIGNKSWESRIDHYNWFIINYDQLKKWEDYLLSKKFDVCIIDEAHFLAKKGNNRTNIFMGCKQNKKKKDSKEHRGIIKVCKKLILLTGTPITSRPENLYNLLKMCNHSTAKSWMNFVVRYCNAKRTRFGLDTSGCSNSRELYDLTRDVMLGRNKEDVLDLPPKTRRTLVVEIDKREYNKLWTDYKNDPKNNKAIMNCEALVMLGKLKMAWSIAKLPATIELIEEMLEEGEKVLVFTNYTQVATTLKEHFSEFAVMLTGGMTDKQKQESVDSFQNNENIRLLIGNLKAAGVGYNMTEATQVVKNDFSFIPADHFQAEDRAHRITTKHHVQVTYMVANGTIDERLADIIIKKVEYIANCLEGKDVTESSVYSELHAMLTNVKQD